MERSAKRRTAAEPQQKNKQKQNTTQTHTTTEARPSSQLPDRSRTPANQSGNQTHQNAKKRQKSRTETCILPTFFSVVSFVESCLSFFPLLFLGFPCSVLCRPPASVTPKFSSLPRKVFRVKKRSPVWVPRLCREKY